VTLVHREIKEFREEFTGEIGSSGRQYFIAL
jgi:hypothetical protein